MKKLLLLIFMCWAMILCQAGTTNPDPHIQDLDATNSKANPRSIKARIIQHRHLNDEGLDTHIINKANDIASTSQNQPRRNLEPEHASPQSKAYNPKDASMITKVEARAGSSSPTSSTTPSASPTTSPYADDVVKCNGVWSGILYLSLTFNGLFIVVTPLMMFVRRRRRKQRERQAAREGY